MAKRILDINGRSEIGVNQPLVKDINLWNRLTEDVAKNNTFCPDITRIIFNVGERKLENGKTKPTLATTVFFNDNTKVTCLNSEHDDITLVTDAATGATTASDVDKERGIIYCTVKKLISTIDPNTCEMKTEGFGRILRELVAMGWDQQIEDKKRANAKALLKANAAKAVTAKTTELKKNASLHDTVNRLADVVEKLNDKLSAQAESKTLDVKKPAAKKTATKKSARKPQKRNSKGQFI